MHLVTNMDHEKLHRWASRICVPSQRERERWDEERERSDEVEWKSKEGIQIACCWTRNGAALALLLSRLFFLGFQCFALKIRINHNLYFYIYIIDIYNIMIYIIWLLRLCSIFYKKKLNFHKFFKSINQFDFN